MGLRELFGIRQTAAEQIVLGLPISGESTGGPMKPIVDDKRPALAMPEECKIGSPVASYREFYRRHKKYDRNGNLMAVWSKRKIPHWWDLAS
jgi:hypothetical protein